MADKITLEQRRKTMQSIRSQSKLENEVSKLLWKEGYRFRKNVKTLFGTPDISIKKYKVVIFIDSCFWHVCEIHGHLPKTNSDFWEKKLRKNQERDMKVSTYYKENGWHILRVWEHEIKLDPILTIKKISAFIENAKKDFYKNKI